LVLAQQLRIHASTYHRLNLPWTKYDGDCNVIIATGLRLLVAPAVATVVAIPFGLSHVEYATGILQAGMPAAVLVSIIAIEHDVVPEFGTTTVFFSTPLSLLPLEVLLTLI